MAVTEPRRIGVGFATIHVPCRCEECRCIFSVVIDMRRCPRCRDGDHPGEPREVASATSEGSVRG